MTVLYRAEKMTYERRLPKEKINKHTHLPYLIRAAPRLNNSV